MAPFPHPAHRTGQADLPHPALGQDFTPSLSRATPSAVSEHSSELIGCPISRSLTTYCVRLELRSLPSPGITRLQRYDEPLRHPTAPDLSLAGVRLVIADHASGLPVLRALSLCTCCRQYPGAAAGRNPRSSHPAVAAFPDSAVGSACTSTFSRLARRSLAVRPAHSRGHQVVTAIRRLQPFRYLHDCSDCFRLERIAGWACTHWKAPPFHGARRKRSLAERDRARRVRTAERTPVSSSSFMCRRVERLRLVCPH